MTVRTDPIQFEILKNALNTLVDEMALTIYRTAASGVLKDVMDYSTAFCDGQGRMVAQGLTLPSHLGSIPDALAATMRRYAGDIAPGDVFILNDPYEGGMHLPDIFLFTPIFVAAPDDAAGEPGATPLGWATTICHHTDVGGRVAGSNASDSTEIYQEGLRIPPLKLYRRGQPDEGFFRLLAANVRVPDRVLADLRAQLSACHGAAAGFTRLVEKYGPATMARAMDDLIDYGERLARAAIAELPDGRWTFDDVIDDDGVDYGVPIPLHVTVTKRGDHLTVDWTGSAAQVKGAINSTYSYTKSASYAAVKTVLRGDIPNNEGFFRAVEVIAPPGTVTHGVLPAACAARGLTGFRMVDCCLGALARMAPDRVMAASEGGNTGISIGGYDDQRRPFIYVDFVCSAWGGRPWADGIDGAANLFANVATQSVEVLEREHPIEVQRYEFVQDSPGAGLHRGGAGIRRDYRLTETEAVLQVRADRVTFPPYGLAGGRPGRTGRNLLDPGTPAERPLPGKLTRVFRRGEVFRHEMAGAGGWGDPLEREPARVLADVRNEFISRPAAERDYGVVIDPENLTVDAAATVALRAAMRRERPA